MPRAVQRFGAERAGLVFGWVFTGHQLGAATAAYAAGASRTGLATYMPAIVAAGVLCMLGAMIVLSIRRASPQLQPA